MFSVRNRARHRLPSRALTVAAALALGTALSGGALAQSMVVRSSGPSAGQYPAGKKLAADATITLRSNDQVTVLDKSGTRVLSGPGTFTLDGSVRRDQTSSTQLANLLATGNRARRSRTGAVRGTPSDTGAPRSPNLWFLDVRQSGTFCVAEPSRLLLWRADGSADATTRLTGPDGASASLEWKLGSQSKLWPAEEMPIRSGGKYSLTGPDGASSSFTLVVVPDVPEAVEDVAGTLIENGCENQLGLLVETMASLSDEGEPAGD